jgi:prohibitin 2
MKKIAIISLMFLSGCGFEIVNTGHRGVKVRLGEVIGEPLPEGFYVYNPITTSIKEINIRETKENFKTLAYSKDAQVLDVEYTVNFKPLSNQIHNIYKDVGYYWQDVLLKQVLEGNIKEVIGKYVAVELIEKRQEVVNSAIDEISKALLKKKIELLSLEITNMNFDDQFEEAIKLKVIAVEQAKEAVNKTVRVKEESEQRIISAKAEAESMRIRSNALSQNKSLVEYEAVQKWDGKLPNYMMGNSVPFINIKGM